MYAHIQLGARDIDAMAAFYDAILPAFGFSRDPAMASEAAGVVWRGGSRWPQFVIRKPFNSLPATWGNGVQISLLAPSRAVVDESWRRALAAGGIDEGPPRLRKRYSPDFYAAYCRDPEGNKLCFVHAAD